MIDDTGAELFTCKDCGGRDLHVIHEYWFTTYHLDTVPCHCGKSKSGNSVTVERCVSEYYRTVYALGSDHRFEEQIEESDEIEGADSDDEEISREVECESCLEDANPGDWQTETDESEESEIDDNEFFVRCADCDREIEFGWSHPNRGGRIWPAECTDFNPWKSWPEPRYNEAWFAKGWIRPDARPAKRGAAK